MVAGSREGPSARNHPTRERLLDAAESLVASGGYGGPTHRTIAQMARVGPALVGYHFGTKELLFEAMLERRASELSGRWQRALGEARAKRPLTVERVLEAYWAPFRAEGALGPTPLRNYLCSVAWLSQAGASGHAWDRHFVSVEADFQRAIRQALPHLTADEARQGLRYARALFDSVLLYRCRSDEGTCGTRIPDGLRDQDVDVLVTFLAAGFRGLPYARQLAHEAALAVPPAASSVR